MCTVLLPPFDNPIAVNKYININIKSISIKEVPRLFLTKHNPFNLKINQFQIYHDRMYSRIPQFAQSTLGERLLYRETSVVCSEKDTKHIKASCGQTVQFF